MTQTRKCRTDACCPGLAEVLAPELFQALCDPSRLAVLLRTATCTEPATVGAIAAGLPVSLSVVSRHLATLRRAGIVEARRRGKEVRYRMRHEELAGTLRRIADAVERCCPAGEPGRGRS